MTDILKHCTLCPRECGVDRYKGRGFCGEGAVVRIARAELHRWEEPCISGTKGAGTVFFSGCDLRCCFCQNYEISHEGKGFELTRQQLCETFLRLQEMGAHNIDLVNPTHFLPQITEALDDLRGQLTIPVVYNSGGYDKPESLELTRGYVSIFLPDLKYSDGGVAAKYSGAADYPERAFAAIHKMFELAGRPQFDSEGIMHSGVIVRHLILPSHRHDSIALIKRLREEFQPGDILVSLMNQYTPVYKAHEHHEIDRRLSTFEYRTVAQALEESGFDGYLQEKDSASEEFIPTFYDKKYY